MRIIYMGTPDFALPALKALHESSHEVVALYSQPPRPAGRGHKLRKSVTHIYAEAQGIPVETPKTLRKKEAQDVFEKYDADIAVVAAYGLILPKDILGSLKHGCINIHGSILPRWRGAAPVHRAIETGDSLTGITFMQMDEGLDTGNMLSVHEYPLSETSTTLEVYAALSELGGNHIVELMLNVENGTLLPMQQPSEGVTYAHKVSKAESKIDWSQTAAQIDRKIRAFMPFPGVWCEVNGERLKIHAAEIVTNQGSPGEIIVKDGSLLVFCGKNALKILKLQKSGSKPMGTEEFLRGFVVNPGATMS